jgi:uncharacterized repeat protein (TIGR01451 family)
VSISNRWSIRVVLSLSLMLFAGNALAVSYTSAISGPWSSPGTWSPTGLPGAGDDVTIQSGHTVTLDSSRTINNVTVNGTLALSTSTLSATNAPSITGTINGTSPGALNVSGSATWSAGTFTGSASLNLAPTGTLTIGGASTKTITTLFQLVIGGTVNWTGGTILVNDSSLLNIQSGATFNAQSDNAITNNFGNGTITNAGTFRKTGGAGTTTVTSGVPFTTSGRVELTSGAIDIEKHILTAGAVLGNGFTIVSGTTTIAGLATVDTGAAVTFSGGTLNGSSNLTVNGSLNWTGGTMSGIGGSVTIPAGKTLAISGGTTKTLTAGFQLLVAGTASWSGGTILVNDSSVLNIQTGGVFDSQSDNAITNNFGNGSITNTGTFKKSLGAGATAVTSGVPFSSSGRLEASSGSLDIQKLTLNTGAILGNGFTIVSGTTTIAGASQIEAGAAATFSGGTLNGTANLTVNGSLLWTGGTMSGNGASVTVPAGKTMTIGGGATKTITSSFLLLVAGTANWTGGTILVNDASLVNIQTGGTFDAQSDNSITNNFGNGSITNAGTFKKSAGVGTTTVTSGVPVASSGRMELLSGTFDIQKLTLNTGAVLGDFSIKSGITTIAGASTQEAGKTLAFSGGTINGSANLTVNGSLNWTGGTMSGLGASITLPAGTTSTIGGAATKTVTSSFQLIVGGTLNWSDGTILVNDQSLLSIQSGAVFDAQGDDPITNNFGSGSISNAGTFKKTGGFTTTVTSGVPFNNTGRIEQISGTFDIETLNLNAGSTLAGLNISSGTTSIGGAAVLEAGKTLTLSGGTLAGSSTLTVNGTLEFTGGAMSGGATINVPAGGALNFSSAATKTLSNSFDVNINGGEANWLGGQILVNNLSSFDVLTGGTFDIQTDSTITNNFGNGTISNSGTIVKTAGPGTAAVTSGVPVTNSGRIDVQSGKFTAATLTLAAGTVIDGSGFTISTGTTSVTGTSIVQPAATMFLTGGTLAGTFPLTVNGTFEWSGGSMSGTSASANIASGATLNINGASTKTLTNGFDLNIAGVANWTDGTILVNNTSLLNIQSTGLFDAKSNDTITNNFGSGSISNSGIFRKSAGGGATTVTSGVPFHNTNRIEIPNGTSNIQSLTLGAGSVIGGTGFTLSSGTTTISGASSVEPGAVMTQSGGTLNGTANLTINGTLHWTGGTMSGSGSSVTIPSAGSMTIAGAATKTMTSPFTLNVAGPVTWTGGTILVNNNSLLNIQAGGVFEAQSDNSITNNFGSGSIANNGTFRKTTATGTTIITSGVPFSSPGKIDVQRGAIQLTSPWFSGSTILNFGIAGTTPLTEFGRLAITGAVAFNGTIDVDVIAPYSPPGGAQFAVITYGSRSGTLAESLGFGAGRTFSTTYNPTNLTLTASCDPPVPNVTASAPSFCTGSSVTLSSAPTGGIGPYSFQWFNGDTQLNETSSSLVVTAPGSYSVVVTDSVSCSAQSAQFAIAEDAAPVVAIAGPATACPNAPFTLDAGDGFASYSWSTGDTTRFITVSQTSNQTYEVTVTSGAGCSATDAHTVVIAGEPQAAITAPPSVPADSAGNTASVASQDGAAYNWSLSSGTITSGQGTNQITFTAPAAGTITIGVTVTLNGCGATGSAVVNVTPTDADLAVEKSAASTIEGGGQLVYTIVVTNFGPSDATAVQVVDELPPGTSLAGINSAFFNCEQTGSVVCTGTLLAGASSEISIAVTAPQEAGTIVNEVTVTSDMTDPDASNNSDSAATIVTVPVVCPDEPLLPIEPADNATDLTSPVTFRWSDAGAVSYEVWIVADGAPALLDSTSATSLSAAVPSGTFQWYVVARFAEGCDARTSGERTASVRSSDTCALNAAPQITAPASGATVASPVTIAWTAVTNAIGYRVWIIVDGEAAQDIGSTDALTFEATLPAGETGVFVEALFGGCPPVQSQTIVFNVSGGDPCANRGTATLLAPPNGATVNTSAVVFDWLAAPNATEYRVWAAIGGAAPAVLGTTSETSFEATIENGTVTWWIEALYEGCASTESSRFAFVIPARAECPDVPPSALSPANGSTVTDANVGFDWNAVNGAIGYEVWLSTADGVPTLIGTTGGAATTFSHTVPAGALRWYVIALVDRCESLASAEAAFTYAVPAACEDLQRPVAIAPLEDVESTSPVDFAWSEPAGAIKFELYIVRGDDTPQLVATTTSGQALDVNIEPGVVHWFVRASFSNGCSALDSDERELTIVSPPAACSELAAPVISAPGEISSGLSFLLQWTPIAGATGYQLQIASDPEFEDAESITLGDTSYEVTQTNHGVSARAVYARVRAIDSRCTPEPAIGLYSPISAVFVLPRKVTTGTVPLGDRKIVEYEIALGPEYAGQTFTATSKDGFMTITPNTGVVPAAGITLIAKVDPSSLPAGATLTSVEITLSGPTLTSNATTVTTPISINLVTPVSPSPKSTPPPDAMIIPAVANAAGLNAVFQSDVRVSNTSPRLIKYQLTFVPTGEAGIANGKRTTFSVEPGQTIALDDVLETWFGAANTNAVGSLEIRPLTETATSTSSSAIGALANIVSFASSRTFNITPNGTFGQYIPAVPYANFLGKSATQAFSDILSLQQISQSAKFRTNLGFVEGSGENVDLLVKVFGANGSLLGSFPVKLNGGQHTQLNLNNQGFNVEDGRIEVQVTSGNGKITAYASVLDNATSDAVLVTPVTISSSGNTKWVVPGVADFPSGFANWKTDMRVFNAGGEPVNVTATFHSMNGGAPKVNTLTISPGEVKNLDKVLPALFNVTGDGGAVHLSTETASRLIVTARTYNETSTGSYGLFANAVTPAEAVGVGSRPLQLLQIEESERFRSNIGFAEVTGKPVKLEVTVVPPDAKFSAVTTIDLAANQFLQIGSMLQTLGLGDVHNARISVRAVAGEGRATAYAAVIDMKTNDPTYVPAQ